MPTCLIHGQSYVDYCPYCGPAVTITCAASTEPLLAEADELARLRAELARLRAELAETIASHQRMNAQYEKLSDRFCDRFCDEHLDGDVEACLCCDLLRVTRERDEARAAVAASNEYQRGMWRAAEIAEQSSERWWYDFKRGEHRGDLHYQGMSVGADEVASAIRAEAAEPKTGNTSDLPGHADPCVGLMERIAELEAELAEAVKLLSRGQKALNRLEWEKGETEQEWYHAAGTFVGAHKARAAIDADGGRDAFAAEAGKPQPEDPTHAP